MGGVVTFLFTDLVGSTRALEALGEDAAEDLRRKHFALLRSAAGAAAEEVKNLGDGLMLAFDSPVEAVAAAVRMQESLAAHNAGHTGTPLPVRIGLHAGEPTREDGDYFGTPVVVAKRLCDAASGGQILAGEIVASLVGSRGGFAFRPAGRKALKGLSRAVPVVEVVRRGPAATAPGLPRAATPRGPTLAGRAAELARLTEAFEAAARGQLRVVLIVGDPGIGKTRLATELMARQSDTAAGLSARAHPMAATVPYGLWADALEPYLSALRDDEVVAECGGFLDDLAGLFHRVAAVRGPGATDTEAPRPRLMAGLACLVGNLARRAPTTVLLDDVHWADASSWEVLRHLARRLADAPLLIVATARPVELSADDTAAQVLFELEQDGLLTRLDLAPLPDADLGELASAVAGTAPPALVTWLADRSRGNALYAIGLLRALVEEGADLTSPRLRRLPESLAERVNARVRAYGGPGRGVLEVLAVCGGPVPLRDLSAFTARPAEELAAALADLVAARGVAETERGRELTYEISHPLIREVLYEAVGPARRRLIHRQVARALRENGRVAEAALHFARAADVGEQEAVAALLAAMREAEAREAVREALALLAELLELLPSGDPRWLDVLDAMHWEAEWVVDHRTEAYADVAVRALREIRDLLSGSGDTGRLAAVTFRLAIFLTWGLGDLDAGEAAFVAARDLFEGLGDRRNALLAAREIAWVAGLRGLPDEMGPQAEEVLARAEELGERYLLLHALSAAAWGLFLGGRLPESEVVLERAIGLARADGRSYRLGALLGVGCMTLALSGRGPEGRAMFEQARRLGAAVGEQFSAQFEVQFGWIVGDYRVWAAAAQGARRGTSRRRVGATITGALCAIETGDLAEAEDYLTRASATLDGREWMMFLAYSWFAEGQLAWATGRPGAAAGHLRRAADRLLERRLVTFVPPVLVDLAELAAAEGMTDPARAQLHDLAGRLDRPVHHGCAALADAWAELAGDRHEAAARCATRAVDLLAGSGWQAHLARAHLALGRALAPGDRAEAVAQLQRAARLFEECGAVWRGAAAVAALERLGMSGRRAAAAVRGPGVLSRRERDVAELAAKGLTAREIGAALYVGERTVESHLANVYAKLGVGSKLDLVRRAAELGLL